MSKCDCCGKRGIMSATLDAGIYTYYLCAVCNEKYSDVVDGRLKPEDLITDKTEKGLADFIKENSNIEGDKSPKESVGHNDNYNGNYDNSYNGGSTAGSLIKFLAVIAIILSVIGAFVIGKDSLITAVVAGFVSVSLWLLCYGIGEICCRLANIEGVLRHRK